MQSKDAVDLLIDFAEGYDTLRTLHIDPERREELVLTLVHNTRVILSALLGREPTEGELDEVIPLIRNYSSGDDNESGTARLGPG